jgi:hypothetical protein
MHVHASLSDETCMMSRLFIENSMMMMITPDDDDCTR